MVPKRVVPMLAVAGLLGVMTFALLTFAALHVELPELGEQGDWELASTADCDLMAQSLKATVNTSAPNLRLMGMRAEPGSCQWSRWGIRLAGLSRSQFDAATSGQIATAVTYLM
jgi:hypothetical protein